MPIDYIKTGIIFLLTLIVLVVIHELGHFLIAKKFKIKVEEFGFGIPPRAWGKKIGETILSINWLPIGGFVKLLGEDEVNKDILKDKRSFAAQNVWKRIGVVIAGVVMNLVLAWVLFYITIGSQSFQINAPSSIDHRYTGVNQTNNYLLLIGDVQKDSPAEKAGIKKDERITAINGFSLTHSGQFAKLLKQYSGKEVTLTVSNLDKTKSRDVKVTPRVNPPKGQGALGIAYGDEDLISLNYQTLPQKIFAGISYSWDLIQVTFVGLGKLIFDLVHQNFTEVSQNVSGPVGLAVVTNQIISIGDLVTYLHFMAYISLSLAIFNFLPIPALDGGRLFFLFVEAITRKKVNAEVEKWVHTVGMAALLMLMVLITFSDIKKLIP